MEYITTTKNNKRFKITKEKDDPICLRVSLGGTKEYGYYLVFRGDINEVSEMIDEAQKVLSKAKRQFIAQNN